MPESSPNLVILAGPNGAGKSTSAESILKDALGIDAFVNADVIARGLSGFEPERVSLAAGRIMRTRLRELARQRASFAFETTLATRSFAPWIAELVRHGYEFHLVFLWLPHPDLAVARVAARVRDGGHDVPEETVRRRYDSGLANFFGLYQPMARTWKLCDNSGVPTARLVAAGGIGLAIRVADQPKHGTRSRARYIHETRDRPMMSDRSCSRRTSSSERSARAVVHALIRHKRLGQPIVVWRDGKVVWIPARGYRDPGPGCQVVGP